MPTGTTDTGGSTDANPFAASGMGSSTPIGPQGNGPPGYITIGDNGAGSNDWFTALGNSGIIAGAVALGQAGIGAAANSSNNAASVAIAQANAARAAAAQPTLIAGIPLSYLALGALAYLLLK